MRAPWEVWVGVVIIALSLVPAWMIELRDAPLERGIRLATTILLGIALFAVLKKVSFVRWLLLALLGTGIVVSISSFVEAATIEVTSLTITVAQAIGLGMFFTPAANQWFRKRPKKHTSS